MSRLNPFTHGVPIGVDVASIDKELSSLWKSAADALEGDTGSAVMRACTANIIMYTEDENATERYPSIVQEITAERPARVILVIGTPSSSESSIDAWISAHCHVPVPGGKQVCSEQITLLARGETVQSVPNLILSLLVPDEPVILWFDGNILYRKEIFQRQLRVTDHFVFDSAHFEKPAENISELWEVIQTVQERPSLRPVSFGDLNWSRLLGWRELTAELFDSPLNRERLFEIASIRITYEQERGTKASGLTQAMLFLGWLSARLGWKVASGLEQEGERTLSVSLDRRGNPVKAQLVPVPPINKLSTGILSVEIETDSTRPARFSAARTNEGFCIDTSVQITGAREVHRLAEMRRQSEAQLVGEQIEAFGFDRSYDEALRLAERIARYE